MHGFFITSSGTEIGKTWIMRCLITGLRRRGMTVRALKPIISGWDDASPEASDTGQVLGALDEPLAPAAFDAVSPWRFAAALSPDMAARRENRAIDFEALTAFCRDAAHNDGDVLLVEGVGGVMVPLDDTHTVLDWMAALGFPAILVVGGYLGTISHTLTAHAALRARDISVPLVVVNDTGEAPVPLAETRDVLAKFLPDTAILTLPRRDDDAIHDHDSGLLADELVRICAESAPSLR